MIQLFEADHNGHKWWHVMQHDCFFQKIICFEKVLRRTLLENFGFFIREFKLKNADRQENVMGYAIYKNTCQAQHVNSSKTKLPKYLNITNNIFFILNR